ncbi:NUAK family SNF1-like kinase 1-like [Planoprotostelium fungivorum]|uniref:NUAK family SNF1-like kinase 1-like n=1 Tax=Planoprotostelium fungivorum TaxID=1890364 RepID=A0A2P6N2H8_9EUKA|nr:NUAK family SNF1-like kinase 1-like [Planoprotostelium fungivorum]
MDLFHVEAQDERVVSLTRNNTDNRMAILKGADYTYHDVKSVNQGSYGQIFSAVQIPGGQNVILKKVHKSQQHRVALEISAGIKLKEENIEGVSRLLSYFECGNCIWMVFERVEGMDLFQCMSEAEFTPWNERKVKRIALQLLSTLHQVHEAGIRHKDIKLENIMYSPQTKTATIIDFGLCILGEDLTDDFAGSTEYACPELLFYKSPYSAKAADVWSMGVTLFCLLYGVFPFNMDQTGLRLVLSSGVHPKPSFPTNVKVPSQARDLISRMLDLNAETRLTTSQALEHPWLKRKNSLLSLFSG